MEEKLYPVAEIVNSPHQFSYENGIVVTCVQPGLARGAPRRTGFHQSPRNDSRRGYGHPGGYSGGLLRLLQGGQLRDRLQLNGVSAPSPGGPVL